MNWGLFAQWTIKILSSVPSVIMGVEQIAQGAKQGAAKKDLAMQALGLSSAVAANLAPEHTAAVQAATVLASSAIDNTVAMMNAIQHPSFKQPDSAGAVMGALSVASAPAPVAATPIAAPEPKDHI